MHRFPTQGGIKRDAIIAFLLGVLGAHVIQFELGLDPRGGAIFQTLIVVAIAGGWYHWRNVL